MNKRKKFKNNFKNIDTFNTNNAKKSIRCELIKDNLSLKYFENYKILINLEISITRKKYLLLKILKKLRINRISIDYVMKNN